jgi:hypothetical protein
MRNDDYSSRIAKEKVMKLKYVIYNTVYPVLSGQFVPHNEIRLDGLGPPTSAGFCSISEEPAGPAALRPTYFKVTCWGESLALSLKSQPDDAHLIENLLNKS